MNFKTSCHVRWLMPLALLLALPPMSLAQANGRFSGSVVDQTGAVVGGATVTARNERTGDARTTTTNAEGRFVIAGLLPSVYTLGAVYAQLSPLEYMGLELVAAQDFVIDLDRTVALREACDGRTSFLALTPT